MMKRLYEDYGSVEAAAIIVGECVRSGHSAGWATNDLDLMERIENLCGKFNVSYVNDLSGEWAVR